MGSDKRESSCLNCLHDCKLDSPCGLHEFNEEVQSVPLLQSGRSWGMDLGSVNISQGGSTIMFPEPVVLRDGDTLEASYRVEVPIQRQQLTEGEGFSLPITEAEAVGEPTIELPENMYDGAIVQEGAQTINGTLNYADIVEAIAQVSDDGYTNQHRFRTGDANAYHSAMVQRHRENQRRERQFTNENMSAEEIGANDIRVDHFRVDSIPETDDSDLAPEVRHEVDLNDMPSIGNILGNSRDLISELVRQAGMEAARRTERELMRFVEPCLFYPNRAFECYGNAIDAFRRVRGGREPDAVAMHPRDAYHILRDPHLNIGRNRSGEMSIAGIRFISHERVPEGQIWVIQTPEQQWHSTRTPEGYQRSELRFTDAP